MPVTHTNRRGQTYYLHSSQKPGRSISYYFAIASEGSLVAETPSGFEIYESPDGQVFLRRIKPKLILDAEKDLVETEIQRLRSRRSANLYKIDVRGKTLTIFESGGVGLDSLTELAPFLSPGKISARSFQERFASYQPVMRFTLADPKLRLFAPERFCFRGSVDDWISIGPPETMKKLARKYLKHLGQDSLFELY